MQPVIVARDRKIFGAEGTPGGEKSEVSWIFDGYGVTGIQKNATDEIERLLRSGCDQNIVYGNALMIRQQGAELADPFSFAVLKRLRSMPGQHVFGSSADFLEREQFWRRQTAGEGNHAGLGGEFQEFADGAALHVRGAFGKVFVPIHRAIFTMRPAMCQYFFARTVMPLRYGAGGWNCGNCATLPRSRAN